VEFYLVIDTGVPIIPYRNDRRSSKNITAFQCDRMQNKSVVVAQNLYLTFDFVAVANEYWMWNCIRRFIIFVCQHFQTWRQSRSLRLYAYAVHLKQSESELLKI
jgi:hypothetical protein